MNDRTVEWFLAGVFVLLVALLGFMAFGPYTDADGYHRADGSAFIVVCQQSEWFGPTSCHVTEEDT